MLRGLALGLILLTILAVLLVSAAVANDDVRFRWRNRDAWRDGPKEAELARTTEGVLELIAQRPELASIAAWEVGGPLDAGVFHRADQVRPVAAVTKLLVASALARAFEREERQPDAGVALEAVERFYFEGADMGAHKQAMARLGVGPRPTLAQLGEAAVYWGDPAAADALMMLLGREALEAEVRLLGIDGLFAPAPYSADLARLLEDGAPGAAVDLDRSWVLAERLANDAAYGRRLRLGVEERGMPSYAALRAHRRASSHRGTARAYAALMERIATAQSPWGEALREWTGWPMRWERFRLRWQTFGTKSGSAVSVVCTSSFGQPLGGRLAVSAVFFEDLPTLAWLALDRDFRHEDLEQQLLADPEFRAAVAARLEGIEAR